MTVNSVGSTNSSPIFSVNDFVEKGREAGRNGKVIWSENESGEVKLAVGREKFRDRVVSFLKYLPILRNTIAVKRAIENLRNFDFCHQKAKSYYATALSNKYDNDVTTVAIFSQIKKIKDLSLNQRTINKINKTAEIYYGQGAARNYSRRVTVHLWPYEGIDKGGHASTTVTNSEKNKTEHVSWWSLKGDEYEKEENNEDIAIMARNFDNVINTVNSWKPNINTENTWKSDLYSNFKDQFARSLKSYEVDKNAEIGSADKKMEAGEKARKIIANRTKQGNWNITRPAPKTKEETKALEAEIKNLYDMAEENPANATSLKRQAHDFQLLLDSQYRPRATQIKGQQSGKYGVPAQPINFPMVGKTTYIGTGGSKQSKFVMFGLNEKDILSNVRHVKDNAEAYAELRDAQLIWNKATPEKRSKWQESYNDLNKEIEESKQNIIDQNDLILKIDVAEYENKKGHLEKRVEKLQAEFDILQNKEVNTKDKKEKEKALGEAKKALALHTAPYDELAKAKKDFYDATEKLNKVEKKLPIIAQAKADKTGPEIGYRFASNENNCASMAISAICAGGAENYVALPKMTTFGMAMKKPDEQFANYVKSVQKEMDKLNDKADFVLEKLGRNAPIAENIIASAQEIEEFKNQTSSEWKILNDVEKAAWKPVVENILSNLPAATDDMKTLTAKAKNLVMATEEFYKNKNSSFREKGVETFLHKAFNLHQLHMAALSNPYKN